MKLITMFLLLFITTTTYTQDCFHLQSHIKSGYVDSVQASFVAVQYDNISIYLSKEQAKTELRVWIKLLKEGYNVINYRGNAITDMMLINDGFCYRTRKVYVDIVVRDIDGFLNELQTFLFCHKL